MLLELHVVGKELNSVHFTEEQACTTAENYAVEALQLCQSSSITPAE